MSLSKKWDTGTKVSVVWGVWFSVKAMSWPCTAHPQQLCQTITTTFGLSFNKPVTRSSSNTTHSSNCVCVCVHTGVCHVCSRKPDLPRSSLQLWKTFLFNEIKKGSPLNYYLSALHACLFVHVHRGVINSPLFFLFKSSSIHQQSAETGSNVRDGELSPLFIPG